MSDQFGATINTGIWAEQAEDNNPFVAAKCLCHGYDVFGDIAGKAGFMDYLYLLFKGERPSAKQTATLNLLAIVLANPGPRDPSVHAAMAAYVSGTPAASALMAALAVGAGACQGAHEVLLALEIWDSCSTDLAAWRERLCNPPLPTRITVWPHVTTPPGFDPHGTTCALPVLQTLQNLVQINPGKHLAWLAAQRPTLESVAQKPLNLLGVAAAALADLEFSPAEAEMLILLFRLPGAAAHALEQKQLGFRQFPFFELKLKHDPASEQSQEET